MAEEKLMTEKEWKEKQTRKTRKKHIRNALALVLVAVISVVGTLAYLSKKTDPTTNTFTGSTGLEVKLEEPKWDENNAKDYTPDQIILKNPQLYNGSAWTDANNDDVIDTGEITHSTQYDEYMAMRIDFQDENKALITYENLMNVIDAIAFDTTNWKLVAVSADGTMWNTSVDNAKLSPSLDAAVTGAKSMIFLYTTGADATTVAPGDVTEPLFSQIQIRDGNTEPIKALAGSGDALTGGFPTFKIDVLGAAVDKESFKKSDSSYDVSAATTALIDLLKTK